jgi:GNAT superfamily N-acetyltransferase
MTVTVRKARFDDEEEILALIPAPFEPPGSRPPRYDKETARDAVQRVIAGDKSDILLAEVGGKVVGMLALYVDILMIRFGLRCWLEDFVVLPAHRSQGVGKALLDEAGHWARRFGCTHIQLNSGNGRVDAHRFYKANGMTQESLSFQLPL